MAEVKASTAQSSPMWMAAAIWSMVNELVVKVVRGRAPNRVKVPLVLSHLTGPTFEETVSKRTEQEREW